LIVASLGAMAGEGGATFGEALRVLTLRAGFNSAVVVTGTTLFGAAAGMVGCFAVLRKRALMGDALAHATLPGIAGMFILLALLGQASKSLGALLAGAAVTGLLGVAAAQWLSRKTRIGEDAAIGAVLSVFFGVGVALLSVVQALPGGGQGGIETFIYGQTAAMGARDAVVMAVAAGIAGLASALLLKEFTLVCFNDEFATSEGLPVTAIDLAMMGLVAAVTVVGLQAVGLILVVAMLITPAAAARFWTDRVGRIVALAAVFGGLSGYLGSSASAIFPRAPAGAVIVLMAGGLFTLSLLFGPARGAVAEAMRRARTRWKVARDHFLKESLRAERAGEAVTAASLARARGRTLGGAWALTLLLRLFGFLDRKGDGLALTEGGRARAERVWRNHGLWETYLIERADVAASHVDVSADLVEHVLDEELVRELEASLARRASA